MSPIKILTRPDVDVFASVWEVSWLFDFLAFLAILAITNKTSHPTHNHYILLSQKNSKKPKTQKALPKPSF